MKNTLTTHEIASALHNDEYGGWSWSGALALAEYLEEYEESIGEEIELDIVAIRCEFSEYPSLQDWASDTLGVSWLDEVGATEDWDEDEVDDAIRDYITDNTTLIEFGGGIIVGEF